MFPPSFFWTLPVLYFIFLIEAPNQRATTAFQPRGFQAMHIHVMAFHLQQHDPWMTGPSLHASHFLYIYKDQNNGSSGRRGKSPKCYVASDTQWQQQYVAAQQCDFKKKCKKQKKKIQNIGKCQIGPLYRCMIRK